MDNKTTQTAPLPSNPPPATKTPNATPPTTTTQQQLAKSFILLEALMTKIENLEDRIESAENMLAAIDAYDGNRSSSEDEDGEVWDARISSLEARVEALKPRRADRMLDVVSWAVKAKTGRFLPAEILAMVYGYISVEDEDDCDTDSEIYNGRGRFGIEDEDEDDESD
ncbi:hypothetical protein MMC07_008465 [Pseudocyphellaria aurata]|nr:hypothetical protein [Pseudocyphellaria aurata]